MSEQHTFYSLTGTQLPALETLEGGGLRVQQTVEQNFLRSYLDTADWRLFNSGSALELREYPDRLVLIWRDLDNAHDRFTATLAAMPRTAADIVAEDFRSDLKRVTKGRALRVIVAEQVTSQALKLIDAAANRGLRIDLEVTQNEHSVESDDQHIYARLRFAGDANNLSRDLLRRAESTLGLQPLEQDPLRQLLSTQGIEPLRGSKNPKLPRTVDDFITALARVELDLLELLEQQEAGLFEDADPEFLHDFRIACRRSRTLLPELERSLPAKQRQSINADFSWLSRLSGPLRDLDVVLAEFDELTKRSGDSRGALEPLRVILINARQQHFEAMLSALASRRYGKFKRTWRRNLDRLIAKPGRRGLHKPAAKALKKAYRRVIKQVARLQDHIELEAFHELRKRCKRLRYRLDAFRSLYPTEEVQLAIRTLKDFQDALGRINDLHVQGQLFSSAIEQLDNSAARHEATVARATHLVEILNEEMSDLLSHLQDALNEFAAPHHQTRFQQLIEAGYQ
jgi:CHAD domain-containing protein